MKNSVTAWHKEAMVIPLDPRSKELRRGIIQTLGYGQRGHIGASMSLVEILRTLYDTILNYRANEPSWPDRDRCILSKGHGCLALYVMLAEKGFFASEELSRFCRQNAMLGGHPDSTKIPGIEASTGSLGHGLSVGVGMAINALFDKSGAHVYVILGDGECDEGAIWEAAMAAGKHKLGNLTVLIDYNKYQSYDSTSSVLDLEPFADKWRAFGFHTQQVNGHDINALQDVMSTSAVSPDRPVAVICHTVKGKGINFAENNLQWHHKSKINEADLKQLISDLERY